MAYDQRSHKRVTVYRAVIPDSDELWEVEYEAVADALHFACRDLRNGRRRPLEILEDGVLIHDAASIARACEGGELSAETDQQS
ncbi:MAG: hypothetical protein WD766_07285 [Gemmatimonadota bacterium]